VSGIGLLGGRFAYSGLLCAESLGDGLVVVLGLGAPATRFASEMTKRDEFVEEAEYASD
jgi:hypothetical protein